MFFRYLILVLFAVACNTSTDSKKWTPEDKAQLVQELTESRDLLRTECENLSPEQWNFRVDSGSWSIAEIVEHVGQQQDMHFREVYVISQQPIHQQEGLASENDSLVLEYEFDPNKGIAGFYVQPMGRWSSSEDALAQFTQSRQHILDFVNATNADLRKHFSYRVKLGAEDYRRKRDLHQILLTTAVHTKRHTHQIQKIKAAPTFPE